MQDLAWVLRFCAQNSSPPPPEMKIGQDFGFELDKNTPPRPPKMKIGQDFGFELAKNTPPPKVWMACVQGTGVSGLTTVSPTDTVHHVATARKGVGQGNIFRSMCQEFCPRGGAPQAGTPPGQVHPHGQCAGSTHPIGMHSC